MAAHKTVTQALRARQALRMRQALRVRQAERKTFLSTRSCSLRTVDRRAAYPGRFPSGRLAVRMTGASLAGSRSSNPVPVIAHRLHALPCVPRFSPLREGSYN